jgi:hypothetical protein
MSLTIDQELHGINPSGQVGIWAHSQNVETDILKRYVFRVLKPTGWLWMSSFHTVEEGIAKVDSGELDEFWDTMEDIDIIDTATNLVMWSE